MNTYKYNSKLLTHVSEVRLLWKNGRILVVFTENWLSNKDRFMLKKIKLNTLVHLKFWYNKSARSAFKL